MQNIQAGPCLGGRGDIMIYHVLRITIGYFVLEPLPLNQEKLQNNIVFMLSDAIKVIIYFNNAHC